MLGLGLKGGRLRGNFGFRAVDGPGFELFLLLLDDPLVAIVYLPLLLHADLACAPGCFLCLLVVPHHPLPLLVLLSLKLFDLQLLLQLLLFPKPLLLLLFALFLKLKADLLFVLYLLLEHLDGLELFTHQFFFLLELQVALVNLQMIHDLDVFHAQYLCSFLDYPLCLASKSVVQFDEVPVVAVEPFSLSSVQLAYFFVQFLYLKLEGFHSIS